MNDILKIEAIDQRIVTLNGEKILLYSDVADLLKMEAIQIENTVKDNPDKFPEGYIIGIDEEGQEELSSQTDRFAAFGHSIPNTKAFTQKGFYMLVTILKNENATAIALDIVETFVRMRELSQLMEELSENNDKETQQRDKTNDENFCDGLHSPGTKTDILLDFNTLLFKPIQPKKDK